MNLLPAFIMLNITSIFVVVVLLECYSGLSKSFRKYTYVVLGLVVLGNLIIGIRYPEIIFLI